jgi:hypothetical protein
MKQQVGSDLQISRKATLWRLMRMMFPRTFMMALLLFGGFYMLSRSAAASLMMSSRDITRGPIEVPKSWDDCLILDKENDNTICQDKVRKDMRNICIAFQILNGDEAVPPTYQERQNDMLCQDGGFPPQCTFCSRWSHH